MSENIGLILIDIYGQILRDDNYSSLSFKINGNTNHEFLSIPSTITANQGIYNFLNIKFIYFPGKSLNIKPYSNAIKNITTNYAPFFVLWEKL